MIWPPAVVGARGCRACGIVPTIRRGQCHGPWSWGKHQPEDKQDGQQAVQHPVAFDHVPVMGAGQLGDRANQGLPHGLKGIVGVDPDRFWLGLLGFDGALEDVPEVIDEGGGLEMNVPWGFGPSAGFFAGRLANPCPVGRLVGSTVETGGINKGFNQNRPVVVPTFPFIGQLGCCHGQDPDPGQDQETGVLHHRMELSCPLFAVPAGPVITGRQLPCSRCHQQATQPASVGINDKPVKGGTKGTRAPEAMMAVNQFPPEGPVTIRIGNLERQGF